MEGVAVRRLHAHGSEGGVEVAIIGPVVIFVVDAQGDVVIAAAVVVSHFQLVVQDSRLANAQEGSGVHAVAAEC